MWAALLVFLKVCELVLEIWKEKDKTKTERKVEVAKEIIDAVAEADPKERASRLNATIDNIRLRG